MRRLIALAVLLIAAAPAAAKPLSHDVNGDGIADYVVPDDVDSEDAAGVTVVFGRHDRAAPPSMAAPGAAGLRIEGGYESVDTDGVEVMGDVNGDGLADVLVGGIGNVFVVFGKRDTAPVTLIGDDGRFAPDIRSGRAGIVIGAQETFMRAAGDVNGDGLGDLLTITGGNRTFARVRFGSRRHPLRSGFTIQGGGRVKRTYNTMLGPVGDINGDGRGDVAVAVPLPGGRADGFDVEEMVFVVFGKRDKRPVTISQTGGPSTARVTAGGRAAGFALTHDHACWCEVNQIDPVGDLNGDGRADMAVSWTNPFAAHGDRTDVVYGRRATSPVKLPGRAGLTVTGTGSVTPFAGLGDLTGDRRDDLLVGGDRHFGLWLVRGRRAHGPVAIPGTRAVGPNEFTLAQPIGDVDGDGHADLLVAAGVDDVHFSVVYGADPFAPVDVTAPGTAAVRLPPPPA